jgi:hypothetical protein
MFKKREVKILCKKLITMVSFLPLYRGKKRRPARRPAASGRRGPTAKKKPKSKKKPKKKNTKKKGKRGRG